VNSLVSVAIFTLLAQTGTPVERLHAAADSLSKMRIVSETVLGKTNASVVEIKEVLETAMRDADVSVRRQAVDTIANALVLNAMSKAGSKAQPWAENLRGLREPFLADLETASHDEDDGVRRDAYRGVFADALSPAGELPPALAKRMATVFDSDRSGMIRSLMVNALASKRNSADPIVREVTNRIILRALADPDPYVVQEAGNAAFDAGLPEAVPLLVRQLKNPSPMARMGVAAGLQGYRREARPYLSELETALAREAPGPTRSTLEAAIRLIRQEK
jgi:HEAT repeat protein